MFFVVICLGMLQHSEALGTGGLMEMPPVSTTLNSASKA
jgi:hypothetical protein